MQLDTEQFTVETAERLETHVVTDRVEEIVAAGGTTDGLVLVSTGHTTAAVTTNEAEERLLRDLLRAYADLFPPDDWYFHDQHHIDTDSQPNAYGHILSTMVKRPVLLVLESGDLRMGTYEEVLLIEFDGPRERGVDVTVME